MRIAKVENPNGTLVATYLTSSSVDAIYEWCLDNNITDLKEPSTYHATIIYDKVTDSSPIVMDEYPSIVVERPKTLSIFDNNKLVIEFDSRFLQERFRHYMKTYGFVRSYPIYNPHVTIAYNYTTIDEDNLTPFDFDIEIVGEYYEYANV